MESINGSLRRLQTEYVDLYQAHRFDLFTPLEETMQAFADVVRAGKALYIGVSEWTADQIRAGHELAQQLGVELVSNQPQYSMLWRVIEGEIVPASAELGVSQVVFSPIAQGVLTGKYKPGQPPPAGSRATDEKAGAAAARRLARDRREGRGHLHPALHDRRRADPGRRARDRRQGGRPQPGPAGRRVGAAERERRGRDHRRLTARTGRGEREGRRGHHPAGAAHPDRRGPRRHRRAEPGEDGGEPTAAPPERTRLSSAGRA